MASPHDPPPPPPPEERGLVPVTRTVYAAPGGQYASMEFAHVPGCPLAAPKHNVIVRDLVARLSFYDFFLIETAANAVLLTHGCHPNCRFDRGSTLELYTSQRLEDASFPPSPNSLDPSQLTSSGSFLPPLASYSMVPSPSWPSLTPLSAPSPTSSPAWLIPSVAPPLPSTNYGSIPLSSFLRALSSSEQRLYGPGVWLEATSDSNYCPSGDMSSPSPPHAPPPIETAAPAVPHATTSGFASSELALSSFSSIEQRPSPQLLTAHMVVSCRHEQFAGTNDAPPQPPPDHAHC